MLFLFFEYALGYAVCFESLYEAQFIDCPSLPSIYYGINNHRRIREHISLYFRTQGKWGVSQGQYIFWLKSRKRC